MTEIVMFNKVRKEIFEQIGSSFHGTLATCSKDRVTARIISFVVIDNKFYFQTGKDMLKTKQIHDNRNVAITNNAVQIEGFASLLGHPIDFKEFINLYKDKYPIAYEKYSSLECEVLFEVKPRLIKLWKYEDGIPKIVTLDFENGIAEEQIIDSN